MKVCRGFEFQVLTNPPQFLLLLISSLKNTPKNMGGFVFERAKSRDRTAKRTSDYVEAVVKRGSIKKGVMRKLKKNHKKKPVPESLF